MCRYAGSPKRGNCVPKRKAEADPAPGGARHPAPPDGPEASLAAQGQAAGVGAADPPRGRGGFEALVLQARYTYAFGEFVHGHYGNIRANARSLQKVESLIGLMTVNERLDLASLDFRRAWERVWGHENRNHVLYNRRCRKFFDHWVRPDQGALLRRLLGRAEGAGRVHWAFPRGRRATDYEADITCAVREFGEETGLPKGCYRVFPRFCFRETYRHMGGSYDHVYYVALLRRDCEAKVSLRRPGQAAEVGDLAWKGLEELRFLRGAADRSLAPAARAAFRFLRRRLRGKGENPAAEKSGLRADIAAFVDAEAARAAGSCGGGLAA